MTTKLFTVILFSTILTVLGNLTNAQSLDEILEKHFEVMGHKNLSEVKSYIISTITKQNGMALPMTLSMKRPDKFKMEIDMQDKKMIQAFDGKDGWYVVSWVSEEAQDLEGPELEMAKEQANIEGTLYNYKQKGHKAKLSGNEIIDGNEVFVITLTKKDGNIQNFYIDSNTFYISRIKSIISSEGNNVEIVSNLSNYKAVRGFLMAMNTVTSTPMGPTYIEIQKVAFNVDFDDSFFSRPSN